MSPKTSSLAFDEMGSEIASLEAVEAPKLNLIIPKRTQLNADPVFNQAILITGCISVSF